MQVINVEFSQPRHTNKGFVPASGNDDIAADETGRIIPMVWYQDSAEKLLMCHQCNDVWLDMVPLTLPMHLIECESCLHKGYVSDYIPQRLR